MCFFKFILNQLDMLFGVVPIIGTISSFTAFLSKNTQHWRLQRLRLIFLLIAMWQYAARYNTNAFV